MTAEDRFAELLGAGQPYLLRTVVARMTLKEAASAIGASASSLRHWEGGDYMPQGARLKRYVAWLEDLTARNGGPVELAAHGTRARRCDS